MRRIFNCVAVSMALWLASSTIDAQEKQITVTGKLIRVMAIGGESTGWGMELDSAVAIAGKQVRSLEVSVSGVSEPDKWLDKRVVATGSLTKRRGVETGERTILTIASLKEAKASEAASSGFELTGSEWLLEDLAGSGVMDNLQATLAFPEAGKTAGNGSCNRFFGTVSISGTNIQFGPLASSRRACPEAVMNQEAKYLKALQAATRFEWKDPYLYLHAKGFDTPLRYTRKESAAKTAATCAGTTVDQSAAFGPERAGKAKEFLAALKSAVQKDDRQRIAGMIQLPLTVPPGKPVGTRTQFLTEYERIMTPAVKRSILDQSAECLFGNAQGAMIGDGQVWFDQRSGAEFRIITINPTAQ